MAEIRRGQWVMHGDKVGILWAIGFASCEVHYVDANGDTSLVINAPLSELRQARLEEIPASRLDGESLEIAKQLGYQ